MQMNENFWPRLSLRCAGGITTPRKSVVKLLASPGSPPVPFPPPGKALGISAGRGQDGTCTRAAHAVDLGNGGGPFFVTLPWYLGRMYILTALIARSYLFTSKSQLQRKNSPFIFPLLTHFKKRKKNATVFRKPTFGVLPIKTFSKLSPD